ncbi:HicA-like toxin [Mycobacterium phage LilPharaoh]|uniref:HicA-like toxin n=1 Tax=Mycobacterium phage Amelie TaxID=1913035 RepID=A0A1J0GQ08_9CAUD|nr:hypothetical protein I5G92_gp73 [Mycobacterium phage Amelie]ATN90527.1 HicA-like toxin [Mycobacterium phage LilPharaoh]AVP42651.1 HicA-like toxin [Mycobacterium phage SgtBeansprout]AXC37179.1 HicA-like toxin [Mycobacterium phage Biglebops]QGJ93358.1 HicA-like toxin [Mycobacterium phage Mdavu]UQS94473.1 HicA-like toxin [Mycobacterium phage Nutello]UXE03236.1 HicA-like toxin [Mycobacterium phage Nikao]
MPKRTEVIAKIRKAARAKGLDFIFVREGANHEIWSLDGINIPISRHSYIHEHLALKIYKQCQPKLGTGWWR